MSHIHEKIDFTVEVFIVFENKVLLRMHDKYKKWLSVGGHIELDEDPNEAAVREVSEEVGLDIQLVSTREIPESSEMYTELIPPEGLNRHSIGNNHEHVTLIYFAKAFSDNVVPGEGEQQDNWKWFTKDELHSEEYSLSNEIIFWAEKALLTVGKK
jgi:8-oxo-dGTP pyrophosphatase MutT (NUDIX family)